MVDCTRSVVVDAGGRGAGRPGWYRALALKAAGALVIGALGVVLPLPRVTHERVMATETRHPVTAHAEPAPVSTSTTDSTGATTATTTTGTAPSVVAPIPPASTPPASTSPTTAPAPPTTAGTDSPGAADRVVVGEDTREFTLLGVTLTAAPTTPVLVRTALDGGSWTDWQELHFDTEAALAAVPGAPVPDEPDEAAPGAHSDPLWVGDAGRYELDLPADAAPAAAVHLVYETTRDIVVAETHPAGADPRPPGIVPRSSWGARAPRATPTIASSFQLAVVHHTAGVSDYSAAEVPAVLRSVQAYHMDANGWDDIAYNFAVDRFGRVWEARAGGTTRAVVGAHARGFNTGSTGIVVLGNFETAVPSSAAVNAVASTLAWKFAVHDVDPRFPVAFRAGAGSPKYPPGSVVTLNRIVGHRDVGLTACPGRNLYPYLGPIRSSVGYAWPRLAPPGLALVGNFAADASDDVFLRQPGVLPDQLLTAASGQFARRKQFTVDGSYRPLVGDFDANGFDDVLWYRPGTGSDAVWYSRGDLTFFATATSAVNASYRAFVGDYDGDGDDDVFWYAPGSGREFVWWASGASFRSVLAPQVAGDYRVAVGDFDGDRDDDIFWHGPRGVRDGMWASNGGAFAARPVLQVAGSYVPAAGDYDGNGVDDIVFYAPGPALDHLWLGRGVFQFTARETMPVSGTYRVVRAADLDHDGRDELLWYASPGLDHVWWHGTGVLDRASQTNVSMR